MKSNTMVTSIAALGGFGLDPVDLVVVAVDQRDPGRAWVGVAAVGLVEDGGRPRWRRRR